MRHTFATHALLNGANIKVVSELLGHATIQLTLDVYGHVFPSAKAAAVDVLPYGGTTEALRRDTTAQGTRRAQRPVDSAQVHVA